MTVMSFVVYIPLYLIVVFTGMAGIVLFDKMPAGGVVTAIVMNHMSPVLGALVFIGISAAIMSTMDSLINTGAMTLSIDLYNSNKNKADSKGGPEKSGAIKEYSTYNSPESEKKKLAFSRISTLLVTAVALIISLFIRSILEISWIAADIITTGVFVPLIAGFFWRRGNSKGAMASMIFGLFYCTYNLLISFGVPLPSFWQQQSALQVIIGVTASAVIYVTTSLITKPEYTKADDFIAMTKKKSN